MPCKTKELQRVYGRKWIARRRADWFAGKCCALCGSTERLEIDHIDKALKVSNSIWSWSAARRDEELAKCRVLCHDCHTKRHHEEWRKPITHGTYSGYAHRGCRCDLCRQANAEHARSIRKKRSESAHS